MRQRGADTLGHVDHRMALLADDGQRAAQLHRERSAAARAREALADQVARTGVAQAGECERGQLQAAADAPARRPAIPVRALIAAFAALQAGAVVDARHLVAGIAQLGDAVFALQIGHARQFAFGRADARGGDARHRPGLAIDEVLRTDAQRLGGRHVGGRRRVEADDVAAVVLTQPAGLAGLEQRVPFVPAAALVAPLQPPDQRKAGALPAPARAELQGAVVVEQFGALADAAQRLAFTQQGAAAKTAHRERRRGRAELDRGAAVRAGGAVGALR